MTDPNSNPSGDGTPSGDTQITGTTRTAEDIETEYKARLSGKDKAHAEAIKALQEQHAAALAALQQDSQTKITEAETKVVDLNRLIAENADLQAKLQATTTDVLKARYPKASEALGDSITAMEEAKLTDLEQRLNTAAAPAGTTQPSAGVLPNTASRSAGTTGTPALDSMNSTELKANLAKEEEQFLASLRG